jgi:hypothetical protein
MCEACSPKAGEWGEWRRMATRISAAWTFSFTQEERERERERERRENMAFAWRRLSFQILSIPKVFTCIPQTNMARDSWCYVNSSIAKVKTQ